MMFISIVLRLQPKLMIILRKGLCTRCDGSLGVVYLQYWFKSTREETFLVHMVVLKGFTINLGGLDQPKLRP
jgi:hypothetical protein